MRTPAYLTVGIVALALVTGCSGMSRDARLKQSQASLDQGQYEAALTGLEALARAHPRDPEIQLLLGRALLALERAPEAVTAFETAEQNGIGQTAEFHLWKGIALYRAGSTGNAAASLDSSLRIQPSGEAYRYLGLVRSRQGNDESAVQAFTRASGLDNDPTALAAYGISLYNTGRNAAALEAFTRALAMTPGNEALIFQTAHANLLTGHPREAIELYGRLPVTSMYYPDALYNQGEAYLRLGENNRAIDRFDTYLALVPDDHAAVFNLATALIGAEDYSRAADLLTLLLEDDVYRTRAEYNLGLVNHSRGRIVEAVRFYTLAVRHDPDNLRYRYAFALALTGNGDLTSAHEQIDELLARDPGNADARAWIDRYMPDH